MDFNNTVSPKNIKVIEKVLQEIGKKEKDISRLYNFYFQNNMLQNIVEHFKKYLLCNAHINEKKIFYYIGMSYYRLNNHTESINYLNKYLINENLMDTKEQSSIHNTLGIIYLNKKEYNKSSYHFLTSMSLNERAIAPIINLGYINYIEKRFCEAENLCRKVLKMSPEEKDAKKILIKSILSNHRYTSPILLKELNLSPNEKIFHLIEAIFDTEEPNLLQPLTILIEKEEKEENRLFITDFFLKKLREKNLKITILFLEKIIENKSITKNEKYYITSVLGDIFFNTNKKTAKSYFEKLIQIDNTRYNGYLKLGSLIGSLGNTKEALNIFLKANDICKNNAEILLTIGKTLLIQKNSSDAIYYLKLSLLSNTEKHINDIYLNLAVSSENLGDKKNTKNYYYLACNDLIQSFLNKKNFTFTKELHEKCNLTSFFKFLLFLLNEFNWDLYEQLKPLLDIITNFQTTNNLKLSLSNFSANIFYSDFRYSKITAQQHLPPGYIESINKFSHKNHSFNKDNLKIGYISSDLRRHAVGFMLRDSFKYHSKNIKPFCYYTLESEDNITNEIKNNSYSFKNVFHNSIEEIANIIKNDNIDILIDLNGLTKHCKPEILCYKPAPIQASFLGTFVTMGKQFVDYHINSKDLFTKEYLQYYTEKIVSLKHLPIATKGYEKPNRITQRSDLMLPEDKFIITCFNKGYRITKNIFTLWCQILKKNKNIVLWLNALEPPMKKSLLKIIKKEEIYPEQMILTEYENIISDTWHHTCADLYLDSELISGGTTTLISLFTGVPVISLKGENPDSRLTSIILEKIGLNELVFDNHDNYVDYIVNLSNNKDAFSKLKNKVKEKVQNSNLFNPEAFIKDLEGCFYAMIDDYLNPSEEKIIVQKN